MTRILAMLVPAVAIAALPWRFALLIAGGIALLAALVAVGSSTRRTGAVIVAALAVAALTAGRDAFDASHIGAPIHAWTASYHCPAKRQTLSTNDWVKAPNPNVQYYYNGWQDLIGCQESIQLGIGSR